MLDVVIIGGGPAGLSAALYLARANVRTVLLDAGGPRHGAADGIHSLLTHDGRSPTAFRELAWADLGRYDAMLERRDIEALSVEGERDGFRVRTADGGILECRRLLLATGVRDVLPDIPGLREAWATSVHHCPWCWGVEGGGGRTGLVIDQVHAGAGALAISRFAGEVHGFWHGEGPVPEVLRQVFERRGFTLHDRRVRALDLDGKQLRGVELEEGTVPLDLLYLHPHQEQVPLVQALGVDLHEDGSVIVDERGQTTVRGIYAAGDLTTRIRQQVVHALSSGAEAGVCLTFDLSGPEDFNALFGEHKTAPAEPDR